MATLADFGFEIATVSMSVQVHDTKISIAAVVEKPKEQPNSTESQYNTEYICKLIGRDRYIFDTRGWPNGINKKEFDRLWDLDFAVPEEGYFWNAGHFSYAVREAKRYFKADKEEIWRAIEKHKASQVNLMAEGWKHSFEWELRTAHAEKKTEDVEHWQGHALKAWKCYNDCLRELGLPEQPVPEKACLPT